MFAQMSPRDRQRVRWRALVRTLLILALVASVVSVAVPGATAAASPASQAISPALAVATQLQSLLGISVVRDLSQANDPDQLLGQSGQYISRTLIHDDSLAPFDPTQVTGSVEVFAVPSAARNRVSLLLKSGAYEYDQPLGSNVVVRLYGVDAQSSQAAALQQVAPSIVLP